MRRWFCFCVQYGSCKYFWIEIGSAFFQIWKCGFDMTVHWCYVTWAEPCSRVEWPNKLMLVVAIQAAACQSIFSFAAGSYENLVPSLLYLFSDHFQVSGAKPIRTRTRQNDFVFSCPWHPFAVHLNIIFSAPVSRFLLILEWTPRRTNDLSFPKFLVSTFLFDELSKRNQYPDFLWVQSFYFWIPSLQWAWEKIFLL